MNRNYSTEEHRQKIRKKNEQNLKDLWDGVEGSKVCGTGITKTVRQKNIFPEITVKILPKLVQGKRFKKLKLQVG